MVFSNLSRRTLLKGAALSLPAISALPRMAAAADPPPAPDAPAETPFEAPPPRAERPGKIIVLGAGLAGLTAAYELVNWGHDVTVLEAQMHPGGRVRTLRNFSDGLWAEAGAMDFSDGCRHMKHYSEALGLKTVIPGPDEVGALVHVRGRRLPITRDTVWPYELTDEERKLNYYGLYYKYLAPTADSLGDVTDHAWDIQRFKDLDRYTVAEYMKSQGATDEAVEFLAHLVNIGYGWRTGSALHRLASDFRLFNMGKGKQHFFDGGCDAMPVAFAKVLRERIWYGAPVTKVVQEAGKVRVSFRQNGLDQTLEADFLVSTAPVPVLRKMEFTPDVSPRKRQIFEDMDYAPVTRVYVQFRRRFWRDELKVDGGAVTDLPIKLTAEHPMARPDGLGPRGIIESHIRGPEAVAVGALSLDEQISLVVENLEKLLPGISRYVEGGTSFSWHEDPWAGGGYPWWKPGQLTSWLPELAKPEGRIHFAGEHTSHLCRQMEGAVMSGYRAAREVHDAVAKG